jgi:hypothetical protein
VEPDRGGDKDCCEFGLSLLNGVMAGLRHLMLHGVQELICFRMRRTFSAFGKEDVIYEESEVILRLCSEWGSLLVEAIDGYLRERPSAARNDVMESFKIAKLSKFQFIQIGRTFWVNGRLHKDCRCFVFQTILDLTAFQVCSLQGAVYDLCGVVSHIGIPGHGICHYVTFSKVGDDWFCFNDELIKEVGLKEVLDQNFPSNEKSNQTAMLLVYHLR